MRRALSLAQTLPNVPHIDAAPAGWRATGRLTVRQIDSPPGGPHSNQTKSWHVPNRGPDDALEREGDMITEDQHREQRLLHYLARRRSILKGGAFAALGLAVPGGAPRAAPSTPLHFIGWPYHPEIAAENVETF